MFYNENSQFKVEFKIKKILFSDPETFFKVAKVGIVSQKPIGGHKSSLNVDETAQFVIPLIDEGDIITSTVTVIKSDAYGYSLKVGEDYEVTEPQNQKEMVKFIKRKIKGVGVKTAQKMVDYFGMDIIELAQNEGTLENIGIKGAKAERIRNELAIHRSFDQLSSFLYTMNLPIGLAITIYNKLGSDSLNQIQKNPYIITDFDRVSFKQADVIAFSLRKDPLSIQRIESAITSMIEWYSNQGDICINESLVYKYIQRFLKHFGGYQSYENDKVSHELIEHALKNLLKSRKVINETDKNNDTFLYLKHWYQIEENIVRKLIDIIHDFRIPLIQKSDIEKSLKELSSESRLSEEDKLMGKKPMMLADTQREAVYMALTNNISILTGGPGTGKTHTVNTIVNVLKEVDPTKKISLLAPTGKASKRMSEMTKMSAMTIHRKLKLSGYGSSEGIQKIEDDFVIIDEFSMVDAELANTLLSNLGENTHVLFVGDVNQLPSIGPGLVLKDFIESGKIPVTELTEVFRQAQDSQIVMNAHKIMQGKRTIDKDGLVFDHKKGDMYFIEAHEVEHVKGLIMKSIERQMTAYHRPIADICVLSPMRVGSLGINELNQEIQERFNPASDKKSECQHRNKNNILFRENDRVINLVNNLDKDVMNGETGYVSSIFTRMDEKEDGSKDTIEVIEVTFPDELEGDKVIEYTPGEKEDIELAYAISIHKSQGSEFPVVITPIHYSQSKMLSRNLIYTGWTRAKDVLIAIGDKKDLDRGIEKIEGVNRVSLLKEKIIRASENQNKNKKVI